MQKKKLFSLLCSFVFTGTMLAGSFYPAAGKIDLVKAEETAVDSEADYSSGDINGDGNINVFDFNRLNRYLDGSLEFDAEQLKAADFNYDRSVDGNDLTSMAEFITMYSGMPVDYNRRRFIVNAKNFCLKYGETTQIELSIKIPDSWQKNDLSFYGDGEKIVDIPFSDLTEGEKSTIGGYEYTEYSVSVPVADYGDEDTRGLSVDLTVQMNNHESYPIMLNRAVTDAKERIEKSCELIGQVSEYAQQLPVYFPKKRILSEVEKWIEANPNLEITSASEDIINFKTSYGINSYFEVEEEVEYEDTENEAEESEEIANADITENINTAAGNGSSDVLSYSAFDPGRAYATTNKDDLLDIYLNTPKQINTSSDRLTLMDPDVLLYAPCNYDDVMTKQIDKLPDVGTKLANKLKGGTYNEFIGSQYADWSYIQKWNQYGTVMWVAHGINEKDNNGNVRTQYRICEGSNGIDIGKVARMLNDSLNNVSELKSTEQGYKSVFLDDGSIGVTFYITNDDESIKQENELMFGIRVGSGTLMQILSDTEFPNTVLVFGACFGITDDIFNQFLIDHGAAAVIGYKKEAPYDIANNICKELFSYATAQAFNSDFHSHSLDSSLTNAHTKLLSPKWIAASTFYSLIGNISIRATNYYEKDFYYWGRGTLKGNIHSGEGTIVNAYRYYNSELVKGSTVTTDSNGNFEFSDLDWGYYLIQIDDGETETFIRTDFTENELDLGGEDYDIVALDDIQLYVWSNYILLFGRKPLLSEINFWADKLKNHSASVSDMANSMYSSDEYAYGENNCDDNSFVVINGSALIGRRPDESLITMWQNELKSGASRDKVFQDILNSYDFMNHCIQLGIQPY